jgi:hypothetical protein
MITFEIKKFVGVGVPIEICLMIDEYKRENNKTEFYYKRVMFEYKFDPVEEICLPDDKMMFVSKTWTIFEIDGSTYYVLNKGTKSKTVCKFEFE